MTYDCRRLLQYAARSEADCAALLTSADATTSFGHPDPPTLVFFATEPEHGATTLPSCSLLVAYTRHTVSAQLITSHHQRSSSGVVDEEPQEIAVLLPEESSTVSDDEYISCLVVVAAAWKQLRQLPASVPSSSITSSSSLMKGVVNTETTFATEELTPTKKNNIPTIGDCSEQQRLAIVFGTNHSRVYTVEVTIRNKGDARWIMQLVQLHDATSSRSSLFQVFPMDTMLDNSQRRRRSWKRRSSHGGSQTSKNSGATPFAPTGGVVRVSSHDLVNDSAWIVYGDATLVRLQISAFFPSLWQQAAASGLSVEKYVLDMQPGCANVLIRCQIRLPSDEVDGALVVPLPVPSPSPLSSLRIPPPISTLQENVDKLDTTSAIYEPARKPYPLEETYEALVFGRGASNLFPTLCFYTSEGPYNESDGWESKLNEPSPDIKSPIKKDGVILGSVTMALVGSAIGALRWGLGGSVSSNMDTSRRESAVSKNDFSSDGCLSHEECSDPADLCEVETSEHTPATTPFPSLSSRPVVLHPYVEFHDAPRKIEFCSIDPDGKLAAVADGIGRVMLVDLATKQLIRMWKGFREASCYWLQSPEPVQERQSDTTMSSARRSKVKMPPLHLVIHSRQRRVVEVWRVRRGGRVCSIPVGRDARILQFTSWQTASEEALASCYLVHSTVPGSNLNQMELIRVEQPQLTVANTDVPLRGLSSAADVTSVANTSSRNAALRLQHLQQLLSAGNILYSIDDVRTALHEIKSLADLSTALDLLGAGAVLEEKLGVQGSTFHRDVLVYCRGVLSAATYRGKTRTDILSGENPHVQILSHKIEYHTQIVKAFDVLYKFEATKHDAGQAQAKPPSHWAAEAMAWASTHEQVTGSTLDGEVSGKSGERLMFYEFASSCRFSEVSVRKKSQIRIYFSDSSRTRRDVLEHVFKPLLADVFSFNAVYSIFDILGTRSDCNYLQKCFGEWFMTLSVREAYTKGLYSDAPPMVRLLQDLVARQLAAGPISDGDAALGVLCKFCEESSDLVRAFMLGALCLEAVSRASTQKEKWSYGKVPSMRMVNDWKSMLRKLRVCLLVALRMHGKRLAAPVTIDNVNNPEIFSVYEWLARDELSMSHNNEEIISLEKACSISGYSFDPSLPDGDGPSRFKMLQNSCLSAAISEDERAEYLVDFDEDDRFGALLLFLSSYNEPKILAAHRALLLAMEWGSGPGQMDCLKDAVSALKSLYKTPGFVSLAAAVCLEIWQSQLCPVYRSHLFGFADVQQLSEEVVSPLLQNREWLNEVGRAGLQLLAILKECKLDKFREILFESGDDSGGQSWPPLRPDNTLTRLVDKMPRLVDESSLDAHSVVLCALLVSGDVETLLQCVPAINDLFIPQSLFNPVTSSSNVPELQHSYLNDAVFAYARLYSGPALDSFDLGELEPLATIWSFDLETVRTVFLLSMYELGKDRLVDDLLTKSTSSLQIDRHRFVEDGVGIACRRLNVFLSGSRLHTSGMRDVMGLLDADLCEWIKQRAVNANTLAEQPDLEVAIRSTHLLIMRLLSLSASSNVEQSLRINIHSMVVLSGLLVKALTEN